MNCTYVHVYMLMLVNMYIRKLEPVHSQIYIYTYIHIHTHINTYIYTHTHIHAGTNDKGLTQYKALVEPPTDGRWVAFLIGMNACFFMFVGDCICVYYYYYAYYY